jgi:hypothetical protein
MSNDIGFGDGRSPTAPGWSRIIHADTRTASWGRILEILNVNSFLLDYTDFWGRNDPDMLEVNISLCNPSPYITKTNHHNRWATASRSSKNTRTSPSGQ